MLNNVWSRPGLIWPYSLSTKPASGSGDATSKREELGSISFQSSSPLYWDPKPLLGLLNHTPENGCYTISHSSVFAIVCLLVEELRVIIRSILVRDFFESSEFQRRVKELGDKNIILISVPVVVAIPEGFYLPLAILATHLLNIPVGLVAGEDNEDKEYKKHLFSVVLIPLDPTEGCDRIRNVLIDARPILVIMVAGHDQQRMQRIIMQMEDRVGDEVLLLVNSQGLYRTNCRTEIVDICAMIIKFSSSKLLEFDGSLLPTEILRWFQSEHNPNSDRYGNRMSHIVYTSGTTGIPKGCISSFQSLCNYLHAKNEVHNMNSHSIVLLASSLSFDPCFSDILATMRMGATLALVSRYDVRQQLGHIMEIMRVTHCLCTPSLWSTIPSSYRDKLDSLQVVALGGERIPSSVTRIWARPSTDIGQSSSILRLYATYGVTEACVYQTMGEVFRATNNQNTGQDVGIPFPGTIVRICQEDHRDDLIDVPQGSIGEVILLGNQLDRWSNYLDREVESTRFIHISDSDECFYRTGDRGYVDTTNGHLYILGRIEGEEGMVKVNGIRVELGEIEAALLDKDEEDGFCVVDCLIATNRKDDNADYATIESLIAYLVLTPDAAGSIGLHNEVSLNGVLCTPSPLLTLFRQRCRRRSRIIPSVFILIPFVPLSPTGKRSRAGLPPLSEASPLSLIVHSPKGHCASVPLWEYGRSGSMVVGQIIDCLNLQTCQKAMLTTTATFSMLGGDSLAAARVTRGLYAIFNKVNDSRFLGGEFGVIRGPFSVSNLLIAENLGQYVDFLDANGMGDETHHNDIMTTFADNQHEEQPTTIVCNLQEDSDDDHDNLQTTEESQLYDALMQSTTCGHINIVKGLLRVGADPNYGFHGNRLAKVRGQYERKQIFRTSPLHIAATRGLPDLVHLLLLNGAKFNSPDPAGLFPIHLVASGNSRPNNNSTENHIHNDDNIVDEDLRRLQCIRHLLNAGAPLTMKDGNQQTILHAAARSGYCHLLQYVLQEWKHIGETNPKLLYPTNSLNWRDRWSRTPVHWAIINERVETLQLLLLYGCSATPSTPKYSNRTSLALESPMEMCTRLYGSSELGLQLSQLLLQYST